MLNKIKKLNPALIWLSTIAIFIVFIFLLSSNLIDFSNSSNPINALMLIAFLTDILVGIVAFPLMFLDGFRYLRSKPKENLLGKPSTGIKPTRFIIICVVLLSGYFFADWLSHTSINLSNSKEKSFNEFYEKITQLNKRKDYKALYEYLRPIDKDSISLNDFIKASTPEPPVISLNFQIHNVEFRDNIAYVYRTVTGCYSEVCQGKDRTELTGYKKYYYINNKWYLSNEGNLSCNRDEMYEIPLEFKRVIDLIIQREKGGNEYDKVFSDDLKGMLNCLDIQYASSETQMEGAEGYFLFDKSSSLNHLKILVSPKYQIKDDLLTSMVLVHEISHAMSLSEQILYPTAKVYPCFENEARAFANEYYFFWLLNDEEKNSIAGRYFTYSSKEVIDLISTLKTISNNYGDGSGDLFQKALNFVKNEPFYQKQCSS